jgi:hypothetical protein
VADDRVPEPPGDLRPRGRGRKFWRAVASEHVLRADELELLGEVARQLDLVDRLRDAAADGPVVENGRVSPALVELRQVRQELRRGLAQLALPDPDEPEVATVPAANLRTVRARKAAQARWSREP